MAAAFRRDVRCYYHPLAMRILALDTTARRGSVALVADGRVEAALASDGASPPATRLPADLADVLARAGVTLDAVDGFAVAAGPGSFTGLRIGISTMQGLAVATGRPLVGVSALDALAAIAAAAGPDDERDIMAWIDAWRGEVYGARYAADATPLGEAIVGPPGAHLAAGRPGRLIGSGAAAHPEAVAAFGEAVCLVEPLEPALAATLARLAAGSLAAGERPAPHAIRPIYVRRPDAELARDARG